MQTQGNGEVNVAWKPEKEPTVAFEHAVSLKGKNLGLKEERAGTQKDRGGGGSLKKRQRQTEEWNILQL